MAFKMNNMRALFSRAAPFALIKNNAVAQRRIFTLATNSRRVVLMQHQMRLFSNPTPNFVDPEV